MKLNAFLLTIFFSSSVLAQIISIPDVTFKNKLTHGYPNNHGYDTNQNGEIDSSEAAQITSLNLSHATIHDVTGIRSFSNLTYLNLDNCKVSALDLHDLVHLKTVTCEYNFNLLTSVNVSGCVALETLNCNTNPVAELILTGAVALKKLDFHYNALPILDLSGLVNLESLDFSYGKLATVTLTNHPNLKSINFYKNYTLQNLDLTTAPNLQFANLSSCGLIQLKVQNLPQLSTLSCDQNRLLELDLTGDSNIQRLNCSYNAIPSLVVKHCSNLIELYCSNNKITSLDVSNLGLNFVRLYCQKNALTSLNVKNTNLYYLDCSNNFLTTLDLSWINLQYFYGNNNQLTYIDTTHNNAQQLSFKLENNPNLFFVCADSYRKDQFDAYFSAQQMRYVQVDSNCNFKPTFYPNPVIDFINIKAIQNIRSLKIFDMKGQLLHVSGANKNTIDFDFSSYATGNYILEVETEYGITPLKMVKK